MDYHHEPQHSAAQQTSLSVQTQLEGIMPCRSWSGDCTSSTNHTYKKSPLTVLRINTFTSSLTSIRVYSHLTYAFAWLWYGDSVSLQCWSGGLAGGKQRCLISAQCQEYFTGIVALSFAGTIWLKLQMKSILLGNWHIQERVRISLVNYTIIQVLTPISELPCLYWESPRQ